jgi:hypothetical protein
MSGELHSFLTKRANWYEPDELLRNPDFLEAGTVEKSVKSSHISGEFIGHHLNRAYMLDDDGYAKPVDDR